MLSPFVALGRVQATLGVQPDMNPVASNSSQLEWYNGAPNGLITAPGKD
jgi:hypothetical protein